ncbi:MULTISPECIES: hypothetical protein [Paenibacillaceae]|jgi:hypothetical protein|uniref:Uncharacterized protein n=1 Tax=Paenibacillus chartarius TaxID=747481 RepID=A0ABV6DKZ6_9BACL|nr:hypothetical protein [Cohnella algarum]MBN2982238.1 hypothetical protein [Cohnella algarum]
MLERLQMAVSEDAAYFYSASTDKDTARGCIGHLRGYFGSSGETFWSTWFEHSPSLKTPTFRAELDEVVQTLTEQGLLQSRNQMHRFCLSHPEARLSGAWHSGVYGFCFQTEQHRYYLRCFPHAGDYNFYLYCYVQPDRLTERLSRTPLSKETPEKSER